LKPAEGVSTQLCSMSKLEGENIGMGLAMAMATNLMGGGWS